LTWSTQAFREAHFTAVHALDLAPAFVQLNESETAAYERAHDWAVTQIDEWSSPLRDAGIAYDTVVAEGGPAEILLATAMRSSADAIVVGRRDHGPLCGVLGGVSQRVLAYSACPALIVPPR
jgi:nucleotide-binding universal stress UspA family protein